MFPIAFRNQEHLQQAIFASDFRSQDDSAAGNIQQNRRFRIQWGCAFDLCGQLLWQSRKWLLFFVIRSLVRHWLWSFVGLLLGSSRQLSMHFTHARRAENQRRDKQPGQKF